VGRGAALVELERDVDRPAKLIDTDYPEWVRKVK
jgi:hypothetical protein